MSERIFRELPPVDPELEKALERERAKIDEPVYISSSQVVVDTTGLKFENLTRTPDLASAHLGHHYGPVHPSIMPYTPVEKERS